ncbi:unnamed protein product [Lymnaea stagnalis]|uniref:Uncharacterized protein n=1 Tax=Lymnaea stagnalis TaxID=6523 RepID=A0AAV2I6Q7_LYMST
MLSNAMAFYGCMALLFIVCVKTDTNPPRIAENCQERIDECKKMATNDAEILFNQIDIAKCFSSFVCKESEDGLRIKAMFDYGRTISMEGDELYQDGFVRTGSSSLAVIISVSYKTLIISSVTAFLLA